VQSLNDPEAVHDLYGFITRLNGESPRARILLEAGFLEELLRTAIRRRLARNETSEELFATDCSLGLALLAKHARTLGLVGKAELDALKKFAQARNAIAHSWKTDFTDSKLQRISNRLQFIVVNGDKEMADHQRCFARLDYLGVYLTEALYNRFRSMPPTIYDGGTFVTGLTVDPSDGSREVRVGQG